MAVTRDPSPLILTPTTARASAPDRDPGRRIEVEIGELVLTGVRPADRDRVARAFARELRRLLSEQGVTGVRPVGDRDILGGLPAVPRRTSPDRLGRELARSVHEGLTGGGTVTRGGPR